MADTKKETDRKVASFQAGPTSTGSPEETEQLVVTINRALGTIVKIEKIDKAGQHQELSEQDCAKFAGEDELEEMEAALEAAFEAGVDGVLGNEHEAEEYENDEEKAIRRFLISELLIHPSVRRRIMHQLLLSRILRREFVKGARRQ
jgi:hypothetical protein